jgi:outer membrane receptor for monomeric catechols
VEFGPRWQVSGGVRIERYDTEYRAVDAAGLVTTDARAQDALVSGKAGVVLEVNDKGSLYVS